MKQRLRIKVWWPAIDEEAEEFCRTCNGCQVVSGSSNPEPLHKDLGKMVRMDFISPLPSGDYVFVVTDYYSRCVEVSISTKNTADVVCPTQLQVKNFPHFFAVFSYILKGQRHKAHKYHSTVAIGKWGNRESKHIPSQHRCVSSRINMELTQGRRVRTRRVPKRKKTRKDKLVGC